MMMAAMSFAGRPDDRGAGRDEALACLFQAEYRTLVRLACLLLDDRGAGEEVAQEAFVRLYRSWPRLRDPQATPAYLRSTVLNLARSRMRRRLVSRHQPPPNEYHEPSAETRALLTEERREVLAAVRALPRRQRECLILRYYLELSEAEIAVTLRISAGSVKSHTYRGLRTLAQRLEGYR
jgi:RNA polymerase sigma-70 factor (sigma-E family)